MSKINNNNQSIQFRRGTAANLALADTYNLQGEPLYTTDTKQLAVGDGTNTYYYVPMIRTVGRSTGQTAAVASVATYTVPALDGSFEISAEIEVTTSSAENFTVTCAYTDPANNSRTLTLNFSNLAGTFATAINFANGAIPYEGVVQHIRCKASTSITIATTGTFTGATYNVEGIIKQTA